MTARVVRGVSLLTTDNKMPRCGGAAGRLGNRQTRGGEVAGLMEEPYSR